MNARMVRKMNCWLLAFTIHSNAERYNRSSLNVFAFFIDSILSTHVNSCIIVHLTVAAKYNVSAMPTFIFIKGGEIIDRLMGANVDRLQEMIAEHQ